MGLFGGKKKKDLTGIGLSGTAVIDTAGDAGFFDREESTSLADFGIGTVKYELGLDVTLDDDSRPVYRIVDRFKVPAKLEQWATRGVKVPVLVDPDDPDHVEINWDQFDAAGGDQEFNRTASAEQQAAVHQAMPDASRNMMVNGWVQAAKTGALSPAEFDSALTDAVSAGMLTADEADAARKSVG